MYETFFGFRERPFDLTPDPRFLVWTESHLEALRNLEYGIASHKGITLLIGEAGSGKTTIIRAAIGRQSARVHCSHVTNPTLSRAEFNETLAESFGLSRRARSSKAAMLAELEDLLMLRHDRGHSTVLVLDEAQSIPLDLLEEIRLLANTETNAEKLVSIVMAGQPELAARLNDPGLRQLKQRVALRCEIRPLALDETRAYIAGRLTAAGSPAATFFTPESIQLMHDASGGLPRTINVIADNALLGAFAEGSSVVTVEIVRAVCRDFTIGTARTVETGRVVLPPVRPTDVVPLPHALDRDQPRVHFDIVPDTTRAWYPPPAPRYVRRPRRLERLGFAAVFILAFGATMLMLRMGFVGLQRLDRVDLAQAAHPGPDPATDAPAADAKTSPALPLPKLPAGTDVIVPASVPQNRPPVQASTRQSGGRQSTPSAARRAPTRAPALTTARRSSPRVAPPPRPRSAPTPLFTSASRQPVPSSAPASPVANPQPASTTSVTTVPSGTATAVPATTESRAASTSGPPTTSVPVSGSPPPAVAIPSAASNTSAAPAPTAPETAAIQTVLERYRHAYATLSASGIESVWPTVNTGNLQRAFNQLSEQSIAFDSCTITVNAATRAAASCGGRTSFVPKVGSRTTRSQARRWDFQLSRSDGYWIIDRVDTR